MAGDLSQYEYAAYHAILRALALSPASWETEEILTSLRMELHISDEVHMDCRAQVSADREITELRELQRAQGPPIGMQATLPAQHSIPVNAPHMGQPLMTSLSMDAGGGALAPSLSGHQMPGGLLSSHSLPGTGTRSQFASRAAGSLGQGLASFPGSTGGGSIATGHGRTTGLQRRTTGPAATATAGRVAGQGAAAIGAGKGGGGKKGVTSNKVKQNARFASAVPANVDILEDDLRGFVLQRRQDDTSSWQEAVVVVCKREVSAQRLTLVYGLGTAAETFEHDVYLRKGKADILWRFARPHRRIKDEDWDAVAAHNPSLVGLTGGGGPAAEAGKGPTVQGAVAVGGKKRKVGGGAPYSKEALQHAIDSSLSSRKVDELEAMVASIKEKRQNLVGQLALDRVREMLVCMSVSSAKEQLNRELAAVRRKRGALESNGGEATPVNAATGTGIAAPAGVLAPGAAPAAGSPANGAAGAAHAAAATAAPAAVAGSTRSKPGEAADGRAGPAGGGLIGATKGLQHMEEDEETDVE